MNEANRKTIEENQQTLPLTVSNHLTDRSQDQTGYHDNNAIFETIQLWMTLFSVWGVFQ